MTPEVLAQCWSISDTKAARLWPHLAAAMAEFGIDTPARQAAFIAQTGHESGRGTWLTELWGPTPAQVRYERPCSKALRLGNTEHGDGRRYLGRGLIQVTGRANYRACSTALGMDLERFPAQLAELRPACRSAAWFWQSHGCNELADAEQFIAITRIINGGTNGLDDREALWAAAKVAFGEEKVTA